MTFNSDAIVLKSIPTGESDRVITLLTKKKGIVKAFAKSASRPKNKLHTSANIFCYGNYTFFDGGKALKIEECELSEIFFGLRSDIVKLTLAQYFNELTMEFAPVEGNAEEYLRLLLNSLYFLANDKKNLKLLKSIFELRIISISGYMPSLVGCYICGEFETPTMFFNHVNGELRCENCFTQAENTKFFTGCSIAAINAMRHIVFTDLQQLFSLQLDDKTITELNDVTEKYVLNKSQKNYSSLSFYHQL